MTLMLIFIVTLVIALLAQWQVRRMYHRYSRVPAASGYTGAEVAHEILRGAGIRDVDIVEHNGRVQRRVFQQETRHETHDCRSFDGRNPCRAGHDDVGCAL